MISSTRPLAAIFIALAALLFEGCSWFGGFTAEDPYEQASAPAEDTSTWDKVGSWFDDHTPSLTGGQEDDAPRMDAAFMENELATARDLEARGQDRAAEVIYRRYAELMPEDVTSHHRLGVLAMKQARYRESESHLRRALQVDGDNPAVLTDLGGMFLMQERYREAEVTLKNAVLIDPDNFGATYRLARAIGAQGRHQEALRLLNRIMPEADAYNNLALIYAENGDMERAKKSYVYALSRGDVRQPIAQSTVNATEAALASMSQPGHAVPRSSVTTVPSAPTAPVQMPVQEEPPAEEVSEATAQTELDERAEAIARTRERYRERAEERRAAMEAARASRSASSEEVVQGPYPSEPPHGGAAEPRLDHAAAPRDEVASAARPTTDSPVADSPFLPESRYASPNAGPPMASSGPRPPITAEDSLFQTGMATSVPARPGEPSIEAEYDAAQSASLDSPQEEPGFASTGSTAAADARGPADHMADEQDDANAGRPTDRATPPVLVASREESESAGQRNGQPQRHDEAPGAATEAPGNRASSPTTTPPSRTSSDYMFPSTHPSSPLPGFPPATSSAPSTEKASSDASVPIGATFPWNTSADLKRNDSAHASIPTAPMPRGTR